MNNSWHQSMYNTLLARTQLHSEELKARATQEVNFLLRELNLNEGASILDVPCGTGRHSKILAQKGFKVLGLDINQACIHIANAEKENNAHYKVGNMNDLSNLKGEFDATINLFSSFGYFTTDEENEKVMEELVSTLRPGGQLVLNLINRNYLLPVFRPAFWHKTNEVLTINANKFDAKTNYNESYITVKDIETGETSLSYHRMRLYTPTEIVEMMKRHGLKDVRVFGDCTGNPLDEQNSTHPFYFGTKPA